MSAPAVSAIVVNHRSAAEAGDCVASLREAYRRERVEGEIVLVDCASGDDETRALDGVPADVRVFLAENRGYSGGVNAGLAKARGAALLLANADVLFLEGCVTALLAALRDPRVGAAAPLCLWDEAGTLRLPAEAAPAFLDELDLPMVPARFPSFARRTVSLWERGGDTRHLVGAVLAVRRDVFDRAGRFDERYPFEYEETEWEERVLGAGLALRFEPRARARHLFARSARRNPETEARRAASRRRYREKRWGKLGRALLERAATRAPRPVEAKRLAEPAIGARNGAWVAVSTNPSLVPFAGAPLSGGFRLPEDVLASLGPGPVYLRTFDPRTGRPLETFVWEKP